MLRAKSTLEFTGTSASAIYQNRFGDTIGCTFNGPDSIDGKTVDYKAWPNSESPWTSQKQPEGVLEVTDGETVRTYDMVNWKIDQRKK